MLQRIEKKRTERDSEGNETTTLSRHLGEKSHTVKIHENGSGRQNKNETFTNMDESKYCIPGQIHDKFV